MSNKSPSSPNELRKELVSENLVPDNLVRGYQGVAQKWECDHMGHLNVSFYFGRSSDQAFFMRHALGLDPAALRDSGHGTVALEEHCRFHREVKSGGMMIGRSAVVTPNARTMVVYQEFRDEHGAIQACFRTVIGYFDTKARRLVAWPEATLQKAAALTIDLPEHAAPRRVAAGQPFGQISCADTASEGFFRTGGAGVNSWECDQFGHMNTMFYVRRQAEAAPHFWQLVGLDQPGLLASGRGFAVSEMRMNYISELYEGDMVETFSILREVSDRGARIEHRLYNYGTGALSAVSDTSVVSFDLETRKAVPWPDDVRTLLDTQVVADK